MIAYLQGSLLQAEAETIILNVRGVGYELNCSQQTIESIKDRDVIQLWVYTHVREDQLILFGFSQSVEKQLFESLLKVNGIGPKMAIKVLSAAPTNILTAMIENSDVKGLTGLPKIGKKTAEQIILSLKGKLVLEPGSVAANRFVARGEIVSALVNLGFRLPEVEKVVDGFGPETDLQNGIRQGLSALSAQF